MPANMRTFTEQLISIPKYGNDTVKIAEWLGVELTKIDSGWVGVCPLHPDSSPSFNVYVNIAGEDKGFFCFGCGRGGNGVSLLARAKGIPYSAAYLSLFESMPSSLKAHLEKRGIAQTPMLLSAFQRVNALLRSMKVRMSQDKWDEIAAKADSLMSTEDEGLVPEMFALLQAITDEKE